MLYAAVCVWWLDKSINTCAHVALVEKARTRHIDRHDRKKEREIRKKKDTTVNQQDCENREIYEPIFSIGWLANCRNILERVALHWIDCVEREDKYINHAQF